MAKYHYSRYYTNKKYGNFRNPHFLKNDCVRPYKRLDQTEYTIKTPCRGNDKRTFDPFQGYCTDSLSGRYPLIWSSLKVKDFNYADYFTYADGRSVSHYYIASYTVNGNYCSYKIDIETWTCDYDTTYSKGSFKDTVIAESGTYPDNGESGGYWYVKGARVNTAPSTPSSIYVPSDLKEGKSFMISWGSSSDAEGNSLTYKLERSINGGSYSQIYSGSSRNKFETPQASWNTVRYRVRAYDGSLYSGYKASSTVEVKHFPEFKMCINGELKTSADGWVKINGELRKIESIKVKVDGVLKEV